MPDWKCEIRRRLAGLQLAPTSENAIVEELSQYLDDCYAESLAGGATEAEAYRRTLAELSGCELLARELRRMERQVSQEPIVFGTNRRTNMIADLWQDLRFGARMLIKQPGFTLIAVLTLALGIGANTAIFTMINAVLLRSLPVKNPGELVQVVVTDRSSQPGYAHSYPAYLRLRDNGRSLSGLFAAGGVGLKDWLTVSNGDSDETEFVRAQAVSGNFFSVLGVSALIGRTFTEMDDRPDQSQALAVISHSYWQRRFAGDPSVVGRAVTFNDVPFTIVGVTPPGFFGIQPGENPELWWSLQMVPQVDRDPSGGRLKEGQQWLRLMGRLSPGVGQQQSEADLALVYRRYREEYAASRSSKWSVDQRQQFFARKLELRPGNAGWTGLRSQFGPPLYILMAVVAVVLLIACANIASLLLGRAAAREQEFSIRKALGAGRLRLMRQLLAESLLLAAIGGLLGFLLAQGGTRLLQAVMRLESDPLSLSLVPDARVLLFTTAVALLTGLLFGLAPAFRGSRQDLAATLKGGTSGVAGGSGRQRVLQGLVILQVALSLTLLVGAGLFVRTLQRLKGQDAGFNRENIILFNIDFARPEAVRWADFYKELLGRLESLPGVRSASLFSQGYLSKNGWTDSISADGGGAGSNDQFECTGTRVGARFFETFGTPLMAGREFGPQDERPVNSISAAAPGKAVINQALARRYFGDTNPLGKHIFLTHNPNQRFEIVGLAPDAKYDSMREEARPMFYLPFFQEPRSSWANFALRTDADPQAMMASLAAIVREMNGAARVRSVRTMNDVVNDSVRQELLVAQLGGFFSLFALLLACLGLYGMLSLSARQRRREIGVRVALGAQTRDVIAIIVRQGMKFVLIGAAIGLGGGIAVARLVANLLYGVKPIDPLTFVSAVALLALVALVACWIPARRAAKVEPMVALRSE